MSLSAGLLRGIAKALATEASTYNEGSDSWATLQDAADAVYDAADLVDTGD